MDLLRRRVRPVAETSQGPHLGPARTRPQSCACPAAAAAQYGIAPDGAYALRVGENGVVVLPAAEVLARVVRGQTALDHVRNELSVADWLLSRDVPVARPVVTAPVLVNGYVVSFWEFFADGRPADLVTLARCLRQLHAIPVPAGPPGREDKRIPAPAGGRGRAGAGAGIRRR